jgi:hypothetical protein
MAESFARPDDPCALPDQACAGEILAPVDHPWVVAAAEDRLGGPADRHLAGRLKWGWYGPGNVLHRNPNGIPAGCAAPGAL